MKANPCTFVESLELRRLLAADFGPLIDNPYMPMLPGTTLIYRGTDGDGTAIKNRINVLTDTKVIQGITCTIVRDRVFEDGELTEDTRDWFAQDLGGNVWYFGEDSRSIEDGVVVSREGSFEAGVDGARAGIVMKAHPNVGDDYDQEVAPGVAEDHASVLSLHKKVVSPFGTFGDCLQTEETTPLEPGAVEQKFYAPGIGLIKSMDITGGSEVLRLASITMSATAFADQIDNPFMPLAPGTTYFYRGTDADGTAIRERFGVLHDTKVIQGVTCTIVRDRVFEDGALAEDTRDWFAQDLAGNVWYFGEDSRSIENGMVVSRDGSWEAGVSGATPGIVMRSAPGVGDAYRQELATSVAEDQATVLGYNEFVKTPFQSFGNCLKTAETTKLSPDALEHKFYAPGIGLVMERDISGGTEVLRLVDIQFE